MSYLFWFILGTLLGSFALVQIERFPKDQFKTSLFGRSKCNSCQKPLTAIELIPIASYIFQMGKCRHCHKSLSLKYPVSEIIMGALVALTAYYSPSLIMTIINVAVVTLLVIIAGIDYLEQSVVEPLVIIAGAVALIGALIGKDLNSSVLGVLAGGGLFAILVVVSKETWMGYGDIEVGALLGLWLGYPRIITALMLAFIVGAIYGIILIKKNKLSLKSQVPFVPFLVIGGFTGLFWGQKIVDFYLGK